MDRILASTSVGITELKKNTGHLIESTTDAVAILKNNRPAAYLLPVSMYHAMLDKLEDIELAELAAERLSNNEEFISVQLDDL